MTRAEQCALVLAQASKALREEIDFWMHGIDRDEDDWKGVTYDAVSALYDAEESARDHGLTNLVRDANRIFIALGCYTEMTAEDIANTVCSHGSPVQLRLDRKNWEWAADNPAPQFLERTEV